MTPDEIKLAIKEEINGKLDALKTTLKKQDEENAKQNKKAHEFRRKIQKDIGDIQAHMKRVDPIMESLEGMVKEYRDAKVFKDESVKLGDRTIYISKVVGSVVLILGAAYAFLKLAVAYAFIKFPIK